MKTPANASYLTLQGLSIEIEMENRNQAITTYEIHLSSRNSENIYLNLFNMMGQKMTTPPDSGFNLYVVKLYKQKNLGFK